MSKEGLRIFVLYKNSSTFEKLMIHRRTCCEWDGCNYTGCRDCIPGNVGQFVKDFMKEQIEEGTIKLIKRKYPDSFYKSSR